MVIRIELRIFDQIVTSVSFGPKTVIPPLPPNARTLKTIVCQTAQLAKLPPGGSYSFMKYDVFRQNADFFKEWSISSDIEVRSQKKSEILFEHNHILNYQTFF